NTSAGEDIQRRILLRGDQNATRGQNRHGCGQTHAARGLGDGGEYTEGIQAGLQAVTNDAIGTPHLLRCACEVREILPGRGLRGHTSAREGDAVLHRVSSILYAMSPHGSAAASGRYPASVVVPFPRYFPAVAAAWRIVWRYAVLLCCSRRPTLLWKYCTPRPKNLGMRLSGQLHPAMRPASVMVLM